MTFRAWLVAAWLVTAWLLAATLVTCPLAVADDDDDDDHGRPIAARELHEGRPVVALDAEARDDAGIEIEAIALATLAVESRARATVLDPSPLLRGRQAWREARAEAAIANATLEDAERSHRRIATLHADAANVSRRELQEAERAWKEAQAREDLARARHEGARDLVRTAWGRALADLALTDPAPRLEALADGTTVLVEVVLAPSTTVSLDTPEVFVAAHGGRDDARPAAVIGPASRADRHARGETWLAVAPAAGLRIGMTLDAWIPRPGVTRSGVVLDEEAVVWNGGRPWAFVELDQGRFVRRELARLEPLDGDRWLVVTGLEEGQRVVVRGGQVLLSEELRWNIPDEDEVD